MREGRKGPGEEREVKGREGRETGKGKGRRGMDKGEGKGREERERGRKGKGKGHSNPPQKSLATGL